MKKALLLVALIGMAFSMKAQNLTSIYNGQNLAQNDTATVNFLDPEVNVRVHIHNNTNQAINCRTSCEALGESPIVITAICAGQCQTGSLSPEYVVPAGDTYTGLFVDFENENPTQHTTAYYKLTTYNVNNQSDNSIIYLKLEYGEVGILISQVDEAEVLAFPNPAANQVNINYTLPAGTTYGTLQVRNIQGAVVMEAPISSNQGTMTLNIENLPAGIYTTAIKAQGTLMGVRKLVIK